ncbi:MAG: hypothetical protein JW990_11190, partial [Thermoleophilia bacterium]|nr:hypothetical protein [Thermoleophilia bacterium]
STDGLREIRGESFSPYEWQARWTLLGLALLDTDWDEASQQAEAMLDQSQQKMPDDLEELLQRLIDQHALGEPPDSKTTEDLKTTAGAHGYL